MIRGTFSLKARIFGLASLFFLVIAGLALAVDKSPLDATSDCMNMDQTTADRNVCLGQARNGLEAELDKAYNDLMVVTDTPRAKEALKASQRQWLKYRDAELAYFRAVFDMEGTIWASVAGQKINELYMTRISELRSYSTMTDMAD
jgi:uncharacterized protein YecT (DUF1311 family)